MHLLYTFLSINSNWAKPKIPTLRGVKVGITGANEETLTLDLFLGKEAL